MKKFGTIMQNFLIVIIFLVAIYTVISLLCWIVSSIYTSVEQNKTLREEQIILTQLQTIREKCGDRGGIYYSETYEIKCNP
jgi:hypothetical protein